MQDGSIGLVQNFGALDFGGIYVRASEDIRLAGADSSQKIKSGFATHSFGTGLGGSMEVRAPQLYFTGGAEITTATFGSAASGSLFVDGSESIFFEQGSQSEAGRIFSISYGAGDIGNIDVSTRRLDVETGGIASQNVGSGRGGRVRVFAEDIAVYGGASIASVALGAGPGGDLFVKADTIDVVGVDPVTFLPANISVSATQSGNAGNLVINTRQLSLRDGGRVDASTFAAGAAGTIVVNATERVDVAGTVPGSINASLIGSLANKIDPPLRAFFATQGIFVPTSPSGAAGDVTINTPVLTVRDGAEVTVRNDGSGDAGVLTANANTINLLDKGGITASTQQGGGGNIVLNLQDVLLLNREGRLSAEAGSDGDGGNIALTTPVLVALNNSDIIANANQGTGGNIQINAQGIVGIEFRESATPESDITASSNFGVSGVVSIAKPEVDLSAGIAALPANVADADNQVATGCSADSVSQFVATGRGGLPANPGQQIESHSPWSDIRRIDELALAEEADDYSIGEELLPKREDAESSRLFEEATGWTSDEQGRLSLFAASEGADSGVGYYSKNCLQGSVGQTS